MIVNHTASLPLPSQPHRSLISFSLYLYLFLFLIPQTQAVVKIWGVQNLTWLLFLSVSTASSSNYHYLSPNPKWTSGHHFLFVPDTSLDFSVTWCLYKYDFDSPLVMGSSHHSCSTNLLLTLSACLPSYRVHISKVCLFNPKECAESVFIKHFFFFKLLQYCKCTLLVTFITGSL